MSAPTPSINELSAQLATVDLNSAYINPTPMQPVILEANQHPTYAIVQGPIELDDWLLAFAIAEHNLLLNGYSWPVLLTPIGKLMEHFSELRLLRTFGIMVTDVEGRTRLWRTTRFPCHSSGGEWDSRAPLWTMMHLRWPNRHAARFA